MRDDRAQLVERTALCVVEIGFRELRETAHDSVSSRSVRSLSGGHDAITTAIRRAKIGRISVTAGAAMQILQRRQSEFCMAMPATPPHLFIMHGRDSSRRALISGSANRKEGPWILAS
jgi:hypothetical protein